MKRVVSCIFVFVVGLAIGGTTSYFVQKCGHINKSSGVSGSAKVLPMKIYQQETEHSCGGAVVKTLLDYYGKLNGRSESMINRQLETGFGHPNPGTHPDNMVQFLKTEWLEVEAGENGSLDMIYHYVAQGIPVIALDFTWGGHWRMINRI